MHNLKGAKSIEYSLRCRRDISKEDLTGSKKKLKNCGHRNVTACRIHLPDVVKSLSTIYLVSTSDQDITAIGLKTNHLRKTEHASVTDKTSIAADPATHTYYHNVGISHISHVFFM